MMKEQTEKIKLAAEWISSANRIVAFTGAGISTPSGIPDFRSPTSGLWNNLEPEEVASLSGFRRHPQRFYSWLRHLAKVKLNALPNPAHLALADLERVGKLLAVITQNIDNLHTQAGNRLVHELHGHMREMTCIQCFNAYKSDTYLVKVIEDAEVPYCERCGGLLKPNVILYGEQLPYKPLQAAREAAKTCDLMLIIGTSLEVVPASDMPILARRAGAKLIIINFDTSVLRSADLALEGDAAEILPAIVQYLEIAT